MLEKKDDLLMSEDEILKQRTDKLRRLREEEGYDPFKVEKWDRRHTLGYVKEKYDYLQPDEVAEEGISTAGRIMTIRRHGKAAFLDLADEYDTIQLCFQQNVVGEEQYTFFKKWVDTGDFLGVVGVPIRTRRGELSILVKEFKLLSKALRPLPEKWHGLKDTEIRYRHRYVDLIANPEVRETFRKRAKIINAIRSVLEKHGTIEVETPILSPIAGGANARPFITYHNALGINLYLRIATELYLKRLIVGMFGRVYEIGKNFRNEGIDTMHNPEFTAMEVYWAYADYEDIMNLTEELIVAAADAVGGRRINYQGTELILEPPFRRATMKELVKEYCGYDLDEIKSDEEARAFAKKKGLEIKGTESRFVILAELFETFVEDKLIQPTFVIGHPTEISPLAKRNPDNPDFTNRFELYIYGNEVANAFSELNDPLDQRERFLDQAKKKEEGDEEAHAFDEDYIMALEYGLPPTGGLGVGIDRLTMFLTDSKSIRDVILFPTMRPKQ
ncbi:lysyl-tRNA synthetase [Thermovirga lienii DSM 17291]|uniref:Lysine--tRNA ligase n=1 Tax=Thermovirga lienii (strain ATCC BAA-1197 / DSM 17291 / Cas60314) TaxID=580340 RepID=G7V5S6_THELD|nr:lysine--tRNA ligase [Thermovirga lienii]AER66986.1 lysyl-tRNA synthetase [Thermovirga lienii DSM 17291]